MSTRIEIEIPEHGGRFDIVCPNCGTVGYWVGGYAGLELECRNPKCNQRFVLVEKKVKD